MSDTNTTNGVPANIDIERNATKMVFAQNKYSRGNKEGSIYFAPKIEAAGPEVEVKLPENLANAIKWLSPTVVADWIQAKLNLTSQAATEEASCKMAMGPDGKPLKEKNPKTGEEEYVYEDTDFRVADFTKYMQELSTRGESKGDLEARLNDLIDKAEELAKNPEELTPVEHALKIAYIVKEMSTVKHAIQAKARTRKGKTELVKA